MNYDIKDNGEPTASYKWEEQFKSKGERLGTPPVSKLRQRISQLQKAIDHSTDGVKANGWRQELEWRKRQLQSQQDALD